MNSRACLLAVLLAAPAWAEEPAPAAPAPAAAAQAFDLRNESVKKIVHDTAATQYGVVQVVGDSRAATTKATPAAVQFVPAEKPSAVTPQVPALQPRISAPPREDGFLTTLIDTLLEDDEVTYAELHDEWLRCQSRGDDLETTSQRAASCPGQSQETRSVTGNPNDFKKVPAP